MIDLYLLSYFCLLLTCNFIFGIVVVLFSSRMMDLIKLLRLRREIREIIIQINT
jgi:hypothetical protein